MNNPSALTIFNFRNIHPVRVIVGADGEPWFVGKDVCDILGYANHNDAIKTHCKPKGVANCYPLQTAGGTQYPTCITEGNIYRLVIKSNKPEAEPFESWVCDEVLPTIRKTGQYHFEPTPAPAFDPANLSRLDLLQIAIQAEQERLEAVAIIEVIQPKAAALDRLSAADGSACITETAKMLKHPPKKLFSTLSQHRWIYRRAGSKNWLAYQDKIQSGYLEHEPHIYTKRDGTEGVRDAVKVTPKGLAKLAEIMSKATA